MIMEIRDWQRVIFENAKAHGFYEKDISVPELLCFIHEEVSEALQGWKKGDQRNFAEELADIGIILLSICGYLQVDLQTEISKKYAINKKRPYLHGNKPVNICK